MWGILISPSSKKKNEKFEPFLVKYKYKQEAENARWQLIKIATCTGFIAPCDENTGKETTVFTHKPWSVGLVTEC